MKIDDILDNFNSEVLETSYDIDKKELKSKEEYTFTMTIKCNKDIEEERVTINTPLNIIINYDNGKTAIIDINPNTKDSIITYFIIFVLSAISLLLVITKKGKKQLLGLMLLVSLIPIGSSAVSTKKEIVINNDITVYGKTAVFKTGKEVNQLLKELAGTNIVNNDAPRTSDTNITGIRRANELPDGFLPSEDNIISTDESRIPIYAWFDNGVIYYYTDANNPLLNEDASWMFKGFIRLTDLEISTIDSSNTKNMSNLFSHCETLTELDISKLNTSNVTQMSCMFTGNAYIGDMKIKHLDVSHWDVSNVTSMTCMFYGMGALEELDVSKWNVSKVESFNHMFCDNFKLEALNLTRWDVSSVKTMFNMFDDNYKLRTVGDISHWNTINLIDVGGMFNGCNLFVGVNGTIDLSGWNTSNLKVTGEMFRNVAAEVIDLRGWDLSSITDSTWSGTGNGIYYETGNNSTFKGMAGMFKDARNLTNIYVDSNWSIPSGVSTTNMFSGAGVSQVTVVG